MHNVTNKYPLLENLRWYLPTDSVLNKVLFSESVSVYT